jgi:dolichyl-phosphate-mannose-protein mannosyltransferase
MRRRVTDPKKELASEPPRITVAQVTRREWILFGAILAAGIGLRSFALSRSAVEHFDEGVYASNMYFGSPEYAYPMQRFYAPPLLPALIEAGMVVGLPPNLAALLPGFLAGCATIVALWWFGRLWFGPEVGTAAATLAALSDFHILYSTAALTDVLLGLWIVLAIDAIARSLLASDYRWAVGAGIYTGLAWWTKYNGWLPLAIEAAALPVLWLAIRPSEKEMISWLTCFAITALVAGLIWTPYYVSLQSQGGYGPITANHAKYVVGISGWLDAARQQAAAMATLESPISMAGVYLAPAAALLCSRIHGVRRWGYLAYAMGMATAAWVFGVTVLLAGAGAMRMFGWAIGLEPRAINEAAKRRSAVGNALVAVGFIALFIATPLYTPYPRLLLPWLVATWLAAGQAANWLVNLEGVYQELQRTRWRRLAFVFAFAALGIVVALINPKRPNLSLARDRRGLERVATGIRSALARDEARGIYVYAEPALYFQLRAAGEEYVAPVQAPPREAATIDGKAIATFLVVGPHGQRDPQFQEQMVAAQDRWELLQTFDYSPSSLVWLDLHDPRRGSETSEQDTVRLYRLRQ